MCDFSYDDRQIAFVFQDKPWAQLTLEIFVATISFVRVMQLTVTEHVIDWCKTPDKFLRKNIKNKCESINK